MPLLTSAGLVLLVWICILVQMLAIGLVPALFLSGDATRATVARRALWIGLAAVSILLLALSVVTPLGSGLVPLILLASSVLSGSVGWWMWRRKEFKASSRLRNSQRTSWYWLIAGLALAQLTLAFAVLGPATNYDTGLYHLGAIAYGRDYPLIPGLGNLYGPLGYSTLEFVWASTLSGPPFGVNGFRLVNGLLMFVVACDLVLRLKSTRSIGSFILLISVVIVWAPMLGMADFWITSPTQDAAALLLAIVMTAYLADAAAGKLAWGADASVALVVGILLIAVRTTMTVFVALSALVLMSIFLRRVRKSKHVLRQFPVVGAFALLIGAFMSVRDYVLTGWWMYPLSVLPFNVPWRAQDPTGLRNATLGFHRDSKNIEGALQGWSWIGPWLARLPGYWESYLVIGMILFLACCLVIIRRQNVSVRWRLLAVVLVPSAGAVAFWFVASPPALRFIWGPLVLLVTVPAGFFLHALVKTCSSRSQRDVFRLSTMFVVSFLVIAISAILTLLIRIDWMTMTARAVLHGPIPIEIGFAPVPTPTTVDLTLPSGLTVRQPVETDQCWDVYPLCSPGVSQSLRQRGVSISDGFLP